MIALDDFQRLKRGMEELQRQKDKDEGAFNEIMKRLKVEHGCKTLKEAQEKLVKMGNEERSYFVKWCRKADAFKKKLRSLKKKAKGEQRKILIRLLKHFKVVTSMKGKS